jgi:tripartite-type tricarboxylate transporter receptor subunit TctC
MGGKRNLSRLMIAAGALLLALSASPAARADFPDKPIRFLLHVSPGGATDVMGRKLAIGLEKVLGVNVVVENKPGGRGATQLNELSHAKPDGYTIGSVTNTHIGAFNQTLKQYDVDKIDWIARILTEPFLIAVRSDSKIMNMKDFVETAKTKPGSIVMAGFVRGSGGHFAYEMIANEAGFPSANVRWVPFDSVGDSVTAVLGGHAEAVMAHVDLVKNHVEAGTMRVIGIMADERATQFPDAGTLKEQGIDVDTSWQQFRGIIGPKGIPDDVKAKLGEAIEKVLQTPDMQTYLTESALTAAYMPFDKFTEHAKQHDKLTKHWMEVLDIK